MQPLNINFGRRIEKVSILNGSADNSNHTNLSSQTGGNPASAQQSAEVEQLCEVLQNITKTLSHFQDTSFAKYSQDIAQLSVEIARKVLEQKIKEKDYEIEEIIRQALDGVTVKQDIVVKLNPQDHLRIEELLKNSELKDFNSLAFVPDESIQPAECVLQTPQGTIESLIEEKLQRIADALTKTE